MVSFAEKVYAVTRQVPRGKVTTYKAIARALGNRAYRAVGHALHCNPSAPIVPCHRVVASDGFVGGFASGMQKKSNLLRREGVQVKNKHVELKKFFYDVKKEGA